LPDPALAFSIFALTFVACFLPKVRISPQIDAGNGNFRTFDFVLDTSVSA
jgi:hypothetical protein